LLHQITLRWIHTPRAATAIATTSAANPAAGIKLTIAVTYLKATVTKPVVAANEAAAAVVVAAVAR